MGQRHPPSKIEQQCTPFYTSNAPLLISCSYWRSGWNSQYRLSLNVGVQSQRVARAVRVYCYVRVARHFESKRSRFIVDIDFGNTVGRCGFDHELYLTGTLHKGIEVGSFVYGAPYRLSRVRTAHRRWKYNYSLAGHGFAK
jgi:hypothetical protein